MYVVFGPGLLYKPKPGILYVRYAVYFKKPFRSSTIIAGMQAAKN
jgi:hypothetical protein